MSDLPRLNFYQGVGDNARQVGDPIDSTHIPRIGEFVHVAGTKWQVYAIRYLFPQPGSQTYNNGERRPLVDLLVTPSPIAFWDTRL